MQVNVTLRCVVLEEREKDKKRARRKKMRSLFGEGEGEKERRRCLEETKREVSLSVLVSQ